MSFNIGAQTIVWGENIRRDMEKILLFLSKEGYRGVETGMRHFDPSRPKEYRGLYEKYALTPLGVHIGGKFWEPDQAAGEFAKIDAAAAFAAEAGFRHLVVSGNPNETPEGMRAAAETYEGLGEKCRHLGLGFAYHNHDWELKNDLALLRALLDNTSPDNLFLVLDAAWAHRAGADMEKIFSLYGTRIAYVHIKDTRGKTFSELGTGDMDFDLVRTLAEDQGIEWLVVEQDTTTLSPEESMRTNMAYIRSHT
jgi:sugar phosphate isomerase/epimerase